MAQTPNQTPATDHMGRLRVMTPDQTPPPQHPRETPIEKLSPGKQRQRVKDVLLTERAYREQAFRGKPLVLRRKLKEIDEALAWCKRIWEENDRLRRLLGEDVEPQSLFRGGESP